MRFIKFSIFTLACLTLFLSIPVIAADDEEKEDLTPAYVKLSPSIIANVQGKAKYIRLDIQLMTKDGDNAPEIELHTPAIRHELLLLLGDQKGKDLKSKNGQEKLRKIALKSVQKVTEEMTGKKVVDDLFFTYYVVQ